MLNISFLTFFTNFILHRIYLCVPTNALAFKTVERLHRKGFNMDTILHLVAEQVEYTASNTPCSTIRINDFKPDDKIGVIVGTAQLISRLGLLQDNAGTLFMKPPMLAVVIFS